MTEQEVGLKAPAARPPVGAATRRTIAPTSRRTWWAVSSRRNARCGQNTPETQPNAQYSQSLSGYVSTDGHQVMFPISRVAGRRLFPPLAAAQHSNVSSNRLGSLAISAFKQVAVSLREDVMRHGQRVSFCCH